MRLCYGTSIPAALNTAGFAQPTVLYTLFPDLAQTPGRSRVGRSDDAVGGLDVVAAADARLGDQEA